MTAHEQKRLGWALIASPILGLALVWLAFVMANSPVIFIIGMFVLVASVCVGLPVGAVMLVHAARKTGATPITSGRPAGWVWKIILGIIAFFVVTLLVKLVISWLAQMVI
jgi:high-affinity Fe2+/Pb2+ permease